MTDRYSRQVLFAPIGPEGQARIGSSRVALIGCGALGTVSAEMLVRAGIGRLTVVDRDFVEESNLQRQTLFTEAHAADSVPKASAAVEALSAVNSEVEVAGVVTDVSFVNIRQLVAGCDLIIDGTDNFETRYLINDVAVEQALPWIYGGAVGSYGISAAIWPGRTPCLCCLFPEPPAAGTTQTCDTSGVVSPVVHAVAAFQVAAALKAIVAHEVVPDILQIDVWENDWRVIQGPAGPQPDCRCCGLRQFPFLDGQERSKLTRLCGRGAVQVYPASTDAIDLEAIGRRLAAAGKVRGNEHLVRAWVEDCEIALFADGRAIVKGTEDHVRAKALYARYVGG